MSSRGLLDERIMPLLRAWVDGFVYAVTVMAILAVVAVVFGIATGGGFVRGKVFLFVAGWALMVYSTVKLWPSRRSQFDLPSRNLFGLSLGDDSSEDDLADPSERSGDTPSRTISDDQQHTGQYGESLPERHDRTRFQRFVRAVPPNCWIRPPRPKDRMTVAGKLFLASLLVLVLSFVMETVFGVA